MNQISTLFDFTQFQSGWQAGLLLLPVVVAIGWSSPSRRRGRRSPWGLMGPAWVLASLAALDGWFGARIAPVPGRLVWGLVVVALAAELTSRTPNPKILGPLFAFPGAILVAGTVDPMTARLFGDRSPDWVPVLVFIVVTFGGPLAADLDRRGARLGVGPVMWAITVLGVYLTVPDTELIRPLVGAALPLALTGLPLRAARIGPGGAAAGVGLLMWVGAVEGYGRPGSIVGAAGAFGLFLVEPVGRMVLRRRVVPWSRVLSARTFLFAFLGAHLVVVLYETRIAGFVETGGPAFALALVGAIAGGALGGLLGLSKRVRPSRRWFGPRSTRSSSRRAHPSSAPEGGTGSTKRS